MTRKSTINRTLKLMLTLCGVWPGTSCVIICRAYWIIALATDEFCHYQYLLMHLHSNDLFDLMDCFSSFLTQVKFMIKLIIFWMNERYVMLYTCYVTNGNLKNRYIDQISLFISANKRLLVTINYISVANKLYC